MPSSQHRQDVSSTKTSRALRRQAARSPSTRPTEPGTPKSRPRILTFDTNTEPRKSWKPRKFHKWESPLLMISFFVLGLVFSISHCVLYASLDGAIVGSAAHQESNLRIGTALAFLAQITLTASVWQTYHQLIWRSVKKGPIRMSTLNDIFGAETSVLSFLNLDMLKKFRLGYGMALFAWWV
ncbi:hypothetical protein B0T21DRAFT_364903 [Apiosordaria backusii]|uniref:Uncharacterized protein n=1 Tax=Apiosordaria backusii TaxID=314023 RepID=A0AA40BN59_9PEZI|nr:hypothetical protein B0T21DRAFT_364903 [Apiosordaria backusii]